MATLPKIHSGTVELKYPAGRTVRRRTAIHQFCDFSEQRYAKGTRLVRFDLTYQRISHADHAALRTFYINRLGPVDTTWDMLFEGVQYLNCRFVNRTLESTEVANGLWNMRFQVESRG